MALGTAALNKTQQYIVDSDKIITQKITPYLKGRILKIGNGLGYLSEALKENHDVAQQFSMWQYQRRR